MSRIDKILDKMNLGKISIKTAQKYIELEAHTEECKMFAKQAKYLEKMDIVDMLDQYSKTPEEVVLEKEKIEEIEGLLKEIKGILTTDEFDILWMSAVDGISQENIAKKYNTYHQDISRKCESITQKCAKYLENRRTFIEDIFIPPQSKLTAHSPTVRGYPFEMLQLVSVEGHWRVNQKGHRIYVSKTACLIPEYIGSGVVCNLCIDDMGESKCTRKDVN